MKTRQARIPLWDPRPPGNVCRSKVSITVAASSSQPGSCWQGSEHSATTSSFQQPRGSSVLTSTLLTVLQVGLRRQDGREGTEALQNPDVGPGCTSPWRPSPVPEWRTGGKAAGVPGKGYPQPTGPPRLRNPQLSSVCQQCRAYLVWSLPPVPWETSMPTPSPPWNGLITFLIPGAPILSCSQKGGPVKMGKIIYSSLSSTIPMQGPGPFSQHPPLSLLPVGLSRDKIKYRRLRSGTSSPGVLAPVQTWLPTAHPEAGASMPN